MSLAWLRNHARNRHRGTTKTYQRHAAQRAHRQLTSAQAYAPRVAYDNSFVADSSVTSRDADWTSEEQYKRQYFRLGWEITPIRKDGNGLFRSLSDQLYGHERRHLELRRRLVDFIDLECAFFEPFVVGEGVVEYCSRLREAGALGGHPELVAASRLLGINIIVHTGPVKRLHIDTDRYARTKEGKGKTINLLLMDDHYISLRKSGRSFHRQHGCSDTCLCKRIVTPSRASINFRASLDARSSDIGSSYHGHRSLDTRSSLGDQPVGIGSEKRRRAPIVKGAYGRKPVPDADTSSDEDTSVCKTLQMTSVKPRSRPPPPPEKRKRPASDTSSYSMPAKPKTPAPTAPPAQSNSLVHAASKPEVVAPSAQVLSTRSQPPTPVQPKAASFRTKTSMTTFAAKAKSPGVVLFQPESLKPVKPRAPLAVLFDPEQAAASKPTSTTVFTNTTVDTATPIKPTSVGALEEPEMRSEDRAKLPRYGVHRPRRAVFNGGKRRRSSAAALSLLQEVSASLNTTTSEPVITNAKPLVTTIKPAVTVKPVVTTIKPAVTVEAVVTTIKPAVMVETVATTAEVVPAAKPSPRTPRSMEIKKSSKKVFRQGRLVEAH
ncbi:unnamed protein product [Peronospora belbahrii]|uniref:OTU domain-containing protein n=1 Tax=Peronospora belbahrii TaxID=622444 RepID=A0AAU9L154_9STRA|nr:unnamed protein product [Peronospora belbahrii]CAH0517414.1 unnamed protein product [Peronospora belbahrii]